MSQMQFPGMEGPPDPSTRLPDPQGPRNLNPHQFNAAGAASGRGGNPRKPSWADRATGALDKYEAARAFSRPGGLVRAIHYTLSGDPGQAKGVKQIEIGQILSQGGLPGLSRGQENAEKEDGGGD